MSHILSPFQEAVLQAFFQLPEGGQFVLTGGTALAEFHLQHRLSADLDLFTLSADALQAARGQLRTVAEMSGANIQEIRALQTLHQVNFLRGEEIVKVDLSFDPGPWFGDPLVVSGIRVDALENIGPNKLLALFGRSAARDYIDVFFIVHEAGMAFEKIVARAKEKDTGLQEFYLAWWLRQQVPKLKDWPTMLKPLDTEELQRFFLEAAEQMIAGLAPE